MIESGCCASDYRVDSIEKTGKDAGINGFRYRHVGEASPQTIVTPTAVGTGPRKDDLASLGPDIVIWIWYEGPAGGDWVNELDL